MSKLKCPHCKGRGKLTITSVHISAKGRSAPEKTEINCVTCDGKKTVSKEQKAAWNRYLASWCKCKKPGTALSDGRDWYCSKCRKLVQQG
jgi:RecJ-like exonuclease